MLIKMMKAVMMKECSVSFQNLNFFHGNVLLNCIMKNTCVGCISCMDRKLFFVICIEFSVFLVLYLNTFSQPFEFHLVRNMFSAFKDIANLVH